MDKKSIKSFKYDDLEKEVVENLNEKKYRAKQIYEWLYRKRAEKFEEMTNLSENYYIDNLEILKKQVSVDGTKKYLIKLPTGGAIESVLMNYNYRIYNMCINTKRL